MSQSEADEPFEVGDTAPSFAAHTASGELVSSADFLGKKTVVLFFYPRDFTPVCTQQACAFRDAYATFAEAGAVVLGVSVSPSASHQAFIARHQLPFQLLADENGALRKLFRVPSSLWIFPGRVTFVIDREGIIRMIFNSQFQPEKHVQEALRMVKQLAVSD